MPLKWLLHNLVPIVVAGYGLWCICTGQALAPAGIGRGLRTVVGERAVVAGVCYLLLAFIIYVSDRLRGSPSQRKDRALLLVFLAAAFGCLVIFV